MVNNHHGLTADNDCSSAENREEGRPLRVSVAGVKHVLGLSILHQLGLTSERLVRCVKNPR